MALEEESCWGGRREAGESVSSASSAKLWTWSWSLGSRAVTSRGLRTPPAPQLTPGPAVLTSYVGELSLSTDHLHCDKRLHQYTLFR